jgi:hypothetical protein
MNKFLYILFILAGAVTWGCSTLEDDLTDCVQMRVYVDFDDPDAIEWGNYTGLKTLDDNPKYVKLYIFDKHNSFLGVHYITTQKVYELPYKQYDSVQYIAVVSNDIYNDLYPNYITGQQLLKGTKTDTSFISLKSSNPYYQINNIAQSPGDFQIDYGYIPTIRTDNKMAPHFIYVKRKVGAIRCIIIGLNKYLEGENSAIAQKESPYTIMFGETKKAVSFNGSLTGGNVNYIFPNYSEKNDTIITTFINTLPTSSDNASEIKIYKSNYLISKKNNQKNTAVVREGRAVTVIINFSETVAPNEGGMGVSTDKWDSVNVNANF